MTEYELIDVLNGVHSNIIQGQMVFLTIFSAYLVVAYSIGAKLKRYQVSFVNFAYLLFCLIGISGQLGNIENIVYLSDMLAEMHSQYPATGLTRETAPITFIAIRLTMLAGSLVFMWQVRHPKTE